MILRFGLLATALALTGCDQIRALDAQNRAEISQGGAFLLLEVNEHYLVEQELQILGEEMADALRAATPAIRTTARGVSGDAALVRLADANETNRATHVLASLRGGAVAATVAADGAIELRLPREATTQLVGNARNQSLAILQRRFPMREVMVEPRGDRQILLHAGRRFPDPAFFAHRLAMAKLTFHLVDERRTVDATDARSPPGFMLAQPYPGISEYSEIVRVRPALSGPNLTRTSVTFDSASNMPAVVLEFDSVGARAFCRITTENQGKRFAVLFDNQVLTAPTINEPICGGTAQIAGNFTMESANELAQYMGAGALPAPLDVVRQGVDYRAD